MIIKRKNKALIKGDLGTILTEACTLVFDIRKAMLRGGIPVEAIDRVMFFIAEAAKAHNQEEHLANLEKILQERKEGGSDGES